MPDIFVSRREERGAVKSQGDIPTQGFENVDKPQLVEHKKHRHHPHYDKKVLSSLRFYPSEAKFVNKEPEEEVVLIVRKHPIANIAWITPFVLMLFAPGVLTIFPIVSFLPDNFQLVAIMIWYMVTVAVGLEGFLSWFFNVGIVTNERIIDVNFTNLIYKEITEADLQQIQDVRYTVGSVIRTLFKFGDVSIRTASENQGLFFEGVPNPEFIVKTIRDLREAGEK